MKIKKYELSPDGNMYVWKENPYPEITILDWVFCWIKKQYTFLSDVLNVYTDGSTDGYVASNSLPSYDIVKNITSETLSEENTNKNSGNFNLDEPNAFDQYGVIGFDIPANTDIDFIPGYSYFEAENSIFKKITNFIFALKWLEEQQHQQQQN